MLPISLNKNQIFVFGSNATGFHGAGAAGYACRGDHRNNWRKDEWFLSAMKAPVGSPERIGKWAVFGIARGAQRGKEGLSWAIQTIIKPGQKRSLPLEDIDAQIHELVHFATNSPDTEFLVTPIGEGYAGYTRDEMDSLWEQYLIPPNITFIGRDFGVGST